MSSGGIGGGHGIKGDGAEKWKIHGLIETIL